jgi:hypothetical protein
MDGDCGGDEEASEKEGMGVCCYFETRKKRRGVTSDFVSDWRRNLPLSGIYIWQHRHMRI